MILNSSLKYGGAASEGSYTKSKKEKGYEETLLL